ncbi:MAG: beta-propeller domain-containing protein [Limisphaerales bacterium]
MGIEHRGAEFLIRVEVPSGVARVVIEGSRREDLRVWIPKATARVAPHENQLVFSLEADARMEMFRVRAEPDDPLPAEWYAGPTVFPLEPTADPWLSARELADADPFEFDIGVPHGGMNLRALRGDTCFFFNEFRGLQRIDLTDSAHPKVMGTLALPGHGERMDLLGDDHVVLLLRDLCAQGDEEAESAVVVVDVAAVPPVEIVRMPLKGRVVESRWVGAALYVATEAWEAADAASVSWRSGTRVASFDFSEPGVPVPREPLWIPGSGNIVASTDRHLFIAVTDYSRPWPWESDLEILDITSADGSLTAGVSLPLAGRLRDRTQIDVLGDTLRLVLESVESAVSARRVTALETYEVLEADPSATPLLVGLDRLELARGEHLGSVRFEGDLAYFSTFDRSDPLWILDLSDPSDLRVAGELEVPARSTFIHPLGDRLLTLGSDAEDDRRVAVRLFDVSNPAQPGLLSQVSLGQNLSWSEAISREDALAVFPERGLILVPVTEGSVGSATRRVHLLDLGRDVVTPRGFLPGDAVVPRSALLHRDRLLTFSGRALVSAEIGDRDEPNVTSSIELSHPVERVLAIGDHLLEFQPGSVRVRPRMSEGWESGAWVGLGELPVLGAFARDGLLHLLQGRRAGIVWEYDDASAGWLAWTNSGVLVATVWDVSALPALTRLGETRRATGLGALGDAEGFPLANGGLLWSVLCDPSAPGWETGFDGQGLPTELLASGSGGSWRPPKDSPTRHLFSLDVRDPRFPAFLTETHLSPAPDSASVGRVVAMDGLVFSTRRTAVSEVVGTNFVVEMAWFLTWPEVEAAVVDLAEGESKTNLVARNEGVWRAVTNGYPVLRWWSRHEMDVVDYRADPAMPVVREPVEVSGELAGVAANGALILTVGWGTAGGGGRVATLDAHAYDGVAVHRVASLPIADGEVGETFAVVARDGVAYVARGGWGAGSAHRVETWSLGSDGAWVRGPWVGELAGAPQELRWFGDLLVARTGNGVGLLRPGVVPTEPTSAVGLPACFPVTADLNRGDGDAIRGIWLPFADYGSVRLDR